MPIFFLSYLLKYEIMKLSQSILPFALLLLTITSCKQQNKQVSSLDSLRTWKDAKLVFSEEFNTTNLDTLLWGFEVGANGWGNQEWQNYTAGDNLQVQDGKLLIIARREGEGQKAGDYTSTRLVSKRSFMYGRIEIRAKMPALKGNGLWPAIWMLGENIKTVGWPNCGELDIMEYVSFDPNNVHSTIHSVANNHMNGTQVTTGPMELNTVEEEFHNYGLLWEEDRIDFYLDTVDNITLSFERPENYNKDNWPFDTPYYLLMNIAVGGTWGGSNGVDDTIFPATMEVDYVKVWQ